MDHEPAAATSSTGTGRSRAWQEGWAAASRGKLSPNPYSWSSPEFPEWFAGYFAQRQSGSSPPPVAEPDAVAPSVPASPAHFPETPVAAPTEEKPQPPETSETVAPKLAISSPGFAARPPVLRNAELIPPDLYRALDKVWSRSEFAPREISFDVLPEAWVVGEGLVFNDRLEPHPATTVGYNLAEIAAARAAIEEDSAAGRVWYHTGTHVLAKIRKPNDYARFLTGCFPRAAIVHRMIQESELHVVLHRCSGEIMRVAYDALHRIGVTPDRIAVTGAEPHKFSVLIVVDGSGSDGGYLSPLIVGQIGRLATDIAPGRDRALYVKNNAAGVRSLVNEQALLPRLGGYAPIDPSAMTLREQIGAFSGAERIVGTHGPALANIAFCKPGTRVAVITPASMPDTSLWFIAQHRQLEYTDLRCPELPGDAEPPWDRPIALEAQDIELLASF